MPTNLLTHAQNPARPDLAEIAIVGAGQIGFRHLQALERLAFPARIWVVDVSREIAEASSRGIRVGGGGSKCAATYEELPDHLDVAVIATSADTRLAALERLLAVSSLRCLVLEKVLFQKDIEFLRAGEILSENRVRTWVNCGRRLYAIYAKIRERITCGGEPIFLSVSGSNLRLGSNLVHMVDLFAFLCGRTDVDLDASGVSAAAKPSKRSGCIEFDGVVQMRTGRGDSAYIQSFPTAELSRQILVRSGATTWLVDETRSVATEQIGDQISVENVVIPLQSEMSHRFVTDLVETSTCGLTSFTDSVDLHRRMFAGLDDALTSRWPEWLSQGVRPIT